MITLTNVLFVLSMTFIFRFHVCCNFEDLYESSGELFELDVAFCVLRFNFVSSIKRRSDVFCRRLSLIKDDQSMYSKLFVAAILLIFVINVLKSIISVFRHGSPNGMLHGRHCGRSIYIRGGRLYIWSSIKDRGTRGLKPPKWLKGARDRVQQVVQPSAIERTMVNNWLGWLHVSQINGKEMKNRQNKKRHNSSRCSWVYDELQPPPCTISV